MPYPIPTPTRGTFENPTQPKPLGYVPPTHTLTPPTPTNDNDNEIDLKLYLYIAGGLIIAFFVFNKK